MEFQAYKKYLNLFEKYLETSREQRAKGIPSNLFEAMEYSLTAGGKRLRPVLALAAAEACAVEPEDVLPFAMGLEMFHTASLIHDDLPCMDNDMLRRGKPSCHAKYGETLALLAGDALMIQAFEYPLLYTGNIAAEKILKAISIFISAVGPSGVCGGQVLDMNTELSAEDTDYVEHVAELKTGNLIKAAVKLGAALGNSDEQKLSAFEEYGMHLGVAFQIVDDILDVTSSSEILGKTVGKDFEQDKFNFVTKYGLESAGEKAREESGKAVSVIAEYVSLDSFLALLPGYLVERIN